MDRGVLEGTVIEAMGPLRVLWNIFTKVKIDIL